MDAYEEFEEFDDVILEAMFADEQENLDMETGDLTDVICTDERNSASTDQTKQTETRKKRIPRPKSTYSIEKARGEQDALLKETVDSVCGDQFVNEPTFAKAPAVKEFAEKCKASIEANIMACTLQFAVILELFWPVVAASDKSSIGTARQEASYSAFFALRQTANFDRTLQDFFKRITNTIAVPHMFLQIFARYFFERLFLRHEHIETTVKDVSPVTKLTPKEQNALRYAAGYVIFKMPRKIQHKKERKQMDRVLKKMTDGASKDTRLSYSREWVEIQSRGGLTLVNDMTFLFFDKMETVVRASFPNEASNLKKFDIRVGVAENVLKDRTIVDKWSAICSSTELSEHASLIMLQLLVDFYVQIRAFSFAKNIMERFKIQNKSVQKKSKGLRGAMKRAGSDAHQSST